MGAEEDQRLPSKMPNKKFMIIGHRGSGMNMLQSSNPRMKAIKENTITSFNEAAKFDVDFIEFDVQVTQFILSIYLFLFTLNFVCWFCFQIGS